MTGTGTGTGTVYICGHCGRPIGGVATLLGGVAYHYECTQSPYAKPQWYIPPPVKELK
jgi:hypothetical protein